MVAPGVGVTLLPTRATSATPSTLMHPSFSTFLTLALGVVQRTLMCTLMPSTMAMRTASQQDRTPTTGSRQAHYESVDQSNMCLSLPWPLLPYMHVSLHNNYTIIELCSVHLALAYSTIMDGPTLNYYIHIIHMLLQSSYYSACQADRIR